MPRTYFIYIMANRKRVLYTGCTSRLHARVWEHRTGHTPFTRDYHIDKLVYFEMSTDPRAAGARKRQIRSWSRRRRVELVEGWNPKWVDLAASWFGAVSGKR